MSYRRGTGFPIVRPYPATGAQLLVQVTPGTSAARIDLYEAPDDGTGNPATGLAHLVASLNSTNPWVVMNYPNDGLLRFFRAKHVGQGRQDSDYTPWTDGYAPYERETGEGDDTEAGGGTPGTGGGGGGGEDTDTRIARNMALGLGTLSLGHDQASGLTPETVALYMFAEQYGKLLHNSGSGTHAVITPTANTAWESGPAGGSYNLAGDSNAKVEASDPTAFDVGGGEDLTVDAVIRIDDSGTVDYIVRHQYDYYVRFTAAGILEVAVRDGGGAGHGAATMTAFDLSKLGYGYGQWFHLKVKYDYTNNLIHGYYNGRLVDSIARAGGGACTGTIGDLLEIGRNPSAGTTLNGALAYLRVAGVQLEDFPFLFSILVAGRPEFDHVMPVRFTSTAAFQIATDWAYVYPGAAATPVTLYAPLNVPFGATIYGMDAEMYRNAVGDTAQVALMKVSAASGTPSATNTLAHNSTGWQTVSAVSPATFSAQKVTRDQEQYVLKATLMGAAALDARLGTVNVYYVNPP